MIRLDNVSKFYYNQGVISVGFSKVSLNFNMGEFVAITGESGSGKSTLLNVISGLDTYEEGEMFINGEETSHYTEKDFEDYRRKYIGNIFQNFNLVNSYTVYQNIELVLLLAGMKRRDARARANELIERVGLSAYKKTKASKLSGGQKQRVAIARALAKDTPVIIADEPTGNLDSESAADIIKLLADISKEKLVVIVTHNFDQVAPYITRKIKMHDGKILEDTKFEREDRTIIEDSQYDEPTYKNIRPLSEVRLGVRNAFNIPVKFILLTFLFIFIALAFIYEISLYQSIIYYDGDTAGYNMCFYNFTSNRMVIKNVKDDVAEPFTSEDLEKISSVPNVSQVVEEDILNDLTVSFSSEKDFYYIYGFCGQYDDYSYGEPDYGRLPEKDNEIIIVTDEDSYIINNDEGYVKGLLDATYIFDNYSNIPSNVKFKVVGVKFVESTQSDTMRSGLSYIYLNEKYYEDLVVDAKAYYSTIKALFQGESYATGNDGDSLFKILLSDKVKEGECWASSQLNYLVPKTFKAEGEKITLTIENIYYSDKINLKISKIYDKKSFESAYKLGKDEIFEAYDGAILVNPKDYNKLFDKPSYQAGVYVKNPVDIDITADAIRNLGYDVFVLKDNLYNDGTSAILLFLNKGIIIGMAVVLFLISYFVIRIILKSRNVYYSTIRMLGANVSKCRNLLLLDLFVDANIGYFITFAAIQILGHFFPKVEAVKTVIDFMDPSEYIAVYILVIVISILISLRYSSKLFKKSTMQTIKEEV